MQLTKTERETIRQAFEILTKAYRQKDLVANNPKAAAEICRLKLQNLEHEVFAVLFLDAQNQLIIFSEMFRGTLDGASVYPREVVKETLKYNAAALIFAHNHPSGVAEPSQADIRITERLKQALGLIDVRIIDHIIVGASGETVSFAERGLL